MAYFLKTFGLIFLLNFHCFCSDINNFMGVKVSTSLPAVTEKCLLSVHVTRLNIQCYMLCKTTSGCLLACQTGTECRLYNANVSKQWLAADTPLNYLLNGTCYSLWTDERDIAYTAIGYTHSVMKTTGLAEYAVDGFGCKEDSNQSTAETICNATEPAWLVAEFNSPISIEAIIIQARSDGEKTNIGNLEIRLGNSSERIDNPEFTTFVEPTALGKIAVIKGNPSISGKYLSFESKDPEDPHLVFIEMKIIPA